MQEVISTKTILVLDGAARKNGSTAALIRAFTDGAEAAGHNVRTFHLEDMLIKGCTGCEACSRSAAVPCVQNDDMQQIYPVFRQADVVVFASPIYFWTISGPLKTAADRLYAELRQLGYGAFARESVLLMTAGGSDYSQARTWYRTFERNLGWKNRGEILGSGKTQEAFQLGRTI